MPALGELSVLVRGGAIIPHQPLVQSTSETPQGPLELRVYPGPDCHGALYADDGTTFDYKSAGAVTVRTGAAEGTYTPWFSSLAFAIHGAPSAPKQVTVAGAATRAFTYDAKTHVVTITTPFVRAGQSVAITY